MCPSEKLSEVTHEALKGNRDITATSKTAATVQKNRTYQEPIIVSFSRVGDKLIHSFNHSLPLSPNGNIVTVSQPVIYRTLCGTGTQ